MLEFLFPKFVFFFQLSFIALLLRFWSDFGNPGKIAISKVDLLAILVQIWVHEAGQDG